MPSIKKVLSYWVERADLRPPGRLFIDIGEPTCWACGEGWNGRYDVNNSGASWEECVRAWEKAPLQRCHIVPRSLGGTDDPSNIYLMCAECHDLAPDTTISEVFFEWVGKQSNWERKSASIFRSLHDFGVDTGNESLVAELTEMMISPAFKNRFKDKAGLHRAQLPPLGPHLSYASFIGLLVQFWRESKRAGSDA